MAHSDARQPLLAAGLSPEAPSATAHTKKSDQAGGGATAHRVLIWWPKAETAAAQV